MMGGKINIKVVGGIFFAVLILLIFFSKTIYSYNLPVVTAVLPFNGRLSKLETVPGIAAWEDEVDIYADISGTVEEVLVKEGEIVEEGQPLMRFWFDDEEVNTKLKELEVSRERLMIEIENIQKKLDRTNRYIKDLENEEYEEDAVSDYELTQLRNKIDKKKEEYEVLEIRYNAGELARKELENAAYELEGLERDLENLLKEMSEKATKNRESIEEKEKTRQKQLEDYQYDIETMQRDLRTKSLDKTNLDIQEEKYMKTLAEYGDNTVIIAPCKAVVTNLPFGKGQRVNDGQLIAGLGVGSVFTIECGVSADNNFISTGDKCKIANSSLPKSLEGTVTKITPDDKNKKITISIESDEISAGETYTVRFEKESVGTYTLVPNGAVNMDSDGYYVYQLKRRKGILGDEFTAEKLRIYIGDSDSVNTVVVKGITFFEPIVMLSDKPFSSGDTLKIKNEGDFFAD